MIKQFLAIVLILPILLCAEQNPIQAHWFRNPEFQKRLDRTTNSHAHEGNKVSLLINGASSLKQRLENIGSADAILIKTFEFWNDETGKLILDRLIQKAKEGTKVFIQFDVKGTDYPTHPNSRYALEMGKMNPVLEYLQNFVDESQGNGFLIPTSIPYSFLTSTLFNLPIDHEKYFITWGFKTQVDPVRVIMGGMNIGDMYLSTGAKNPQGGYKKVAFYASEGFSGNQALPMRDTDIEVVGSATQDIVERYIESAKFHLKNPNSYFQKNIKPHVEAAIKEMELIRQKMVDESAKAFPDNVGDAFVRLVYKNPREYGMNDPLDISNFFVAMLNQAPDDAAMQFATGFFLPTKEIWKAIYSAASRGVVFQILSNGPLGPENGMVTVAATARTPIRHFLKSMPPGTVDFFQWLGNPAKGTFLMHQKVYSFGIGENEPCCLGSSNLDAQSLMWNSEDVLVIQCPEFKRQLDQMLAEDFSYADSRKITIPQLDKQPFLEKLKEVLMDRILRDFL